MEPYVGEVVVGTATIEVDQTNLETVIPKIGNRVMVVQGRNQGQVGTLKEANLKDGYGVVEVGTK